MRPKIYLDMDGIVADFVLSACRLHNRMDLYGSWPKGEWDMATVFGQSDSVMWGLINKTEGFWSNLEKTHDADDIYKICEQQEAELNFLSSPAFAHSACEKLEWADKYYKGLPTILCRQKYRICASEYDFLVDDSDKNVELWRGVGGRAFLYPRPWNAAHAREATALADLSKELTRWRVRLGVNR